MELNVIKARLNSRQCWPVIANKNVGWSEGFESPSKVTALLFRSIHLAHVALSLTVIVRAFGPIPNLPLGISIGTAVI